MSGTAKIYTDAVTDPTKPDLVRRWGPIVDLLGSYRLVDPEGEVGIEVHVGTDMEGRLMQMPVSYRAEELDNKEATLTPMSHNILGLRYVSNALGDPVAVREIVRTIITGDDGAAYSDGPGPYLDVRGSGEEKDAEVGEIKISEFTRQRCLGTVMIDGATRSFKLRMSNLLGPARNVARGHTTSKLRLTGTNPDGIEYICAELSWRDLL